MPISLNLFSNNFNNPVLEKKLKNFRAVQRYRSNNRLAKKNDAVKALGLSKNTVAKYWDRKSEPTADISPEKAKKVISKVADSDKDILKIILNVYLPDDRNFDCDLTFGKGDFYRELDELPKHRYDKYPLPSSETNGLQVHKLEDIDNPESEAYIPDNSLSSVIIDLPQEISKSGRGNVGAFKSMTDLAESYNYMLELAERKLRFASPEHPGGLLIVKVGDIIHKGETIWLSQIVPELAMGEYTDLSYKFRSKIKYLNFVNFDSVDKFVHRYSPEEIDSSDVASRSIKAHDYYLVFRKKGEDPTETFYYISNQPCNGNKLNGDLMDYEGYAPYVEYREAELREIKRKNPDASIYLVEIPDRTPGITLYIHNNAEPFKDVANRTLESWRKAKYPELISKLPLVFSKYAFASGSELLKFINSRISEVVVPYNISRKDNPVHKKTAQFLRDMGVKYISINHRSNKIAIINEESINIKKTSMKSESTEIFFHGSPKLFDTFDLSHALEGDGKVKFGYGVYVTSQYKSAAHYSAVKPEWTEHYVYTLRVPRKTESNYIAFKQPVHKRIVDAAAERLGIAIPSKAVADGKEFRKYLACQLIRDIELGPEMPKSVLNLMGEKAASEFLLSIGVDFIEWPYNWSAPELGTNRAILNDKAVEIVRIDRVEIDKKKQLIPSSEKQVR